MGHPLQRPEVIAKRVQSRREASQLRAEAIAVMRMNGWGVLDIARMLRIRPATVRAALGRAK